MSISVYLAAPYVARDGLRELAKQLEYVGMTVTSSWLKEAHEISGGTSGAANDLSDTQVKQHCLSDFVDIDRAAVLVLFTAEAAKPLMVANTGNSGGRHVETGYALAKRKKVIVIGEPEHIFHRGLCSIVPDWHEAVLELIAFEKSLPQDALAGRVS
jgi:hypothetical protein